MPFSKILAHCQRRPHELAVAAICLAHFAVLSRTFQDGWLCGGDNTSHLVYVSRVAEMLREGNFRFWLPDFSMGQTLFYYYQPLPHLLSALLCVALPFVEPAHMLKILTTSLLAFVPFSLWQGLRWMGLPRNGALFAALLAFASQSWMQFGYETDAVFHWGLYNQLWGMALCPLVVGYAWREYFGRRRLFGVAAMMGAMLLTHAISGMAAAMSICLLFVVSGGGWRQKLADGLYLSKIFLGAFAVASFLLVPAFLHGEYVCGYFNFDKDHHQGIGLARALLNFFTGSVFDKNCQPILTTLAAMGAGYAAVRLVADRFRFFEFGERRLLAFLLGNFLLAMLLTAGSRTFNWLTYTPLQEHLPFLRMLAHWQLFGVALAAVFLAAVADYLHRQASEATVRPARLAWLAAAALPLVLVGSTLGWRQFLKEKQSARTWHPQQDTSFSQALSFLKNQPHGTVHLYEIPSHFRMHSLPLLAGKPISQFNAASSHTNQAHFYLSYLEQHEPSQYEALGMPYLLTLAKHDFSDVGELIFGNEGYRVYRTPAGTGRFDLVRLRSVVLSHQLPARRLVSYWLNDERLVRSKNHLALAGDLPRSFFEAKGFQNFITPLQDDPRQPAWNYQLLDRQRQEEINARLKFRDQGLSVRLENAVADSLPPAGRILSEKQEDGLHLAQVEVPADSSGQPTWVLLKVNAQADWVASVDGKRVDWVQASPCFMAVEVPPGRHEVRFEFRQSPLRLGLLALSLLTLTGLFCSERVRFFRRRQVAVAVS